MRCRARSERWFRRAKERLQEGAVKVFGSTWTAYPAPGESPLEAGERVCVESVEGASIYVTN